MQYSKPPLSIDEQISLLKCRGLHFKDELKAAHFLSNISYYRLRAYTYPFQDNNDPNHPFLCPIDFDDIIAVYVFDRKLRLLVFDAVEKIEIALRTKLVYHFSLTHGSHWYENANLYIDNSRFIKDIDDLYKEIGRSNETFINHYKAKYSNPHYPPSWMSLEVASMGLLSKIFSNLKDCAEKKQISRSFGIKHNGVMESWLHSFCHVRNICAHHSRLWNRRLTAKPVLPNKPIYQFLDNTNIHTNKLYAILSCMTYILQIISPDNSFNNYLSRLIQSCNWVDLKDMGFPQNWEKEKLWK